MRWYETTPDGSPLVIYAWGEGPESSLQAFPLHSVELWFYYCQYLATNGVEPSLWVQFTKFNSTPLQEEQHQM